MSIKKLNLTLVVCLVFVLTISSYANADAFVARRSHRMAKKRSPQLLGPAAGVGEDPTGVSATVTPTTAAQSAQSSSTTAASSASSSQPASASSTSSSAASSATSSSSGILNLSSLLSLGSSSSLATSSSSGSSSSSSSSSATSSSSSSSSTPTGAPETTQEASVVTTVVSGNDGKVVTLTSTSQPSSTSSAANVSGATQEDSKAKTAAITTLIVVAASVGGVVILWTIFRKWKLARSSKFDQRLQPIDWQPMNSDDRSPVTHRRRASDTSSFHSGAGHAGYSGAGSDQGHGYGATSLPSLPDHDFTAGPAHLAPVGGYADLARGPSPGPQMNELGHGPSYTRPDYDIGVPLHHQTGGYRY
ncbi:hypothetical protein K435DRAFT_789748 [Dendrothele bispora CBS 962.96]|uniref:Mid2 domain-containing protein n=1 Tax=Dendrothele bispora (strain CBS 962.96) TaxID=1314807 RepID=A0A4S8MSZ6_DENBC|nr:hypothetical protein K435DRAFT_789748 [Dendrothele bispora CBS 962.96]